MNQLEQMIRDMLRRYDSGKCFITPNCDSLDCCECLTQAILAALQPIEDELIDGCTVPEWCEHKSYCKSESEKNRCERWVLLKAQYQHMIAQGYVKLPSEELQKIEVAFNEAIKVIRLWHGIGAPPDVEKQMWELYQSSPEMKRINTGLEELHRLLKEKGK